MHSHGHTKHLNTPRLVADDTQTTVWKWEQQEPFGENAANDDPDGNAIAFEFNLRFPGQYFDKGSGLHQNYFRDYDSGIGRYVQSDPIGLAGGLNTYLYVDGDPLRFVDPTGEADVRIENAMRAAGIQSPRPPPPPAAAASCNGRWTYVRYTRDFWSVLSGGCTCYWSCYSCPGGPGDVFPHPNLGQQGTQGRLFFDPKNYGKDFSPKKGDKCFCPKPGPESSCSPC